MTILYHGLMAIDNIIFTDDGLLKIKYESYDLS